VLSSVGLLAVVWTVTRAGDEGWSSPGQLVPLAAGLAALGLFVAWERRTETPMLPVRLFLDRTFAHAAVAALMMYAAVFGALFLLTGLLQFGYGAGPLGAGVRLLPIAVMPTLLARAGGRLADRVGSRPLLIIALALVAAGLGVLGVAVEADLGYPALALGLAVAGAGNAIFFAPLGAAMLSAVPPGEAGRASGIASTLREVGGVLGVAVLGLVFTHAGGYGSQADVVAGFVPAVWTATALAATGAVAAAAPPRKGLPQRIGSGTIVPCRTCSSEPTSCPRSPARWSPRPEAAGAPSWSSARRVSARPALSRPSSPRSPTVPASCSAAARTC
jgi:MFS family permease